MPPKQRKSFPELQKAVEGSWPYIFRDLCPDLAPAMETAPRHGTCPVHGGTDGFRLFKDYPVTGGGYCNTCGAQPNGFIMLAWVLGYTLKDATREVGRWHDGESSVPLHQKRPPIVLPKVDKTLDYEKAYKRIRRTMLESQFMAGTLAELYLLNRGIRPAHQPKTLRFHPSVGYFDKELNKITGYYPCLLAPIRDKENRVISIHRIYLTPEGLKAQVVNPKKMMSACGVLNGSAIKLYEPTDILGVSEGIETALAVYSATGMPVWSCVSAVLMEAVDIPEHVKKVVIWTDLDRSGRGIQAAEKLKARLLLEGKEVEVCIPQGPIPAEEKGIDWLNVYRTAGVDGFPEHFQDWECAMELSMAA